MTSDICMSILLSCSPSYSVQEEEVLTVLPCMPTRCSGMLFGWKQYSYDSIVPGTGCDNKMGEKVWNVVIHLEKCGRIWTAEGNGERLVKNASLLAKLGGVATMAVCIFISGMSLMYLFSSTLWCLCGSQKTSIRADTKSLSTQENLAVKCLLTCHHMTTSCDEQSTWALDAISETLLTFSCRELAVTFWLLTNK